MATTICGRVVEEAISSISSVDVFDARMQVASRACRSPQNLLLQVHPLEHCSTMIRPDRNVVGELRVISAMPGP